MSGKYYKQQAFSMPNNRAGGTAAAFPRALQEDVEDLLSSVAANSIKAPLPTPKEVI
jgi:hypothetical protein